MIKRATEIMSGINPPVESEAQLLAFADALRRKQRPKLKRLPTAPRPMIATVNHGRWIGECACGAGVALDPGWKRAVCLECFLVYEQVIWPVEMDAIEDALGYRPEKNQNWTPGEPVALLTAENIAHGVQGVN